MSLVNAVLEHERRLTLFEQRYNEGIGNMKKDMKQVFEMITALSERLKLVRTAQLDTILTRLETLELNLATEKCPEDMNLRGRVADVESVLHGIIEANGLKLGDKH